MLFRSENIIPFLITRQIFCGAGKWVSNSKTMNFQISQRSEHMWESVSSATTRSRPIINTRDEPHADPEEYRRLHVIVGDSNMSQTTTALKVSATEMILQLIESSEFTEDLGFENPIRAIRDISNDLSFKKKFRLNSGKEYSAIEIQEIYLNRILSSPKYQEFKENVIYRYSLDLWQRTIQSIKNENFDSVNKEIDWVIKKNFMENYQEKNALKKQDSRLNLIDISFHNIRRDRGIFYILEKNGFVKSLIKDQSIIEGCQIPPQSTRAALRGKFIKHAQEKKRDFTVDWVHLKINDQNQKTVVCKDPFLAIDERVDQLIEAL